MNELESATLSTKSSPSGSGGTTKRSFNLTEYKKLLKGEKIQIISQVYNSV